MQARAGEPAPNPSSISFPLLVAFLTVITICAAGLAIRRAVGDTDRILPLPNHYNVFFYLFYRNEGLFIWSLIGFSAFGIVMSGIARGTVRSETHGPQVALIVCVSVAVLLLSRLGRTLILHDYPVSMDEFAAEFQSRILTRGRLAAPMPATQWLPFQRGLTPVFIVRDVVRNVWFASYLPVYAGMLALFHKIGLAAWLNGGLAAASIALIGSTARRLWPEDTAIARFAIVGLALSAQFVLMSMTQYSYPAHLCLNLLWLNLYLRPNPWAFWCLPWVGVLAMGLHNVLVHGLFVAPFLVAIAMKRKRAHTVYCATVYLAGTIAWWKWLDLVGKGLSEPGGPAFRVPGTKELGVQIMNMTLALTWQTPLVAILGVAAFFLLRRADSDVVLIALSTAITVLIYAFYPQTQQHGWGYRYIYGVLGNFVLLASFAFGRLRRRMPSACRLLFMVTVVASIIEVPARAVQVECFVRPFASAADYVRHLPATVVIVNPDIGWYAQDLVRNDPFLRDKPLLMNDYYLTTGSRRTFNREFPSRVHILTRAELDALGYPSVPPR